ncbi:winged helix-turn-helix transcriptional regulator [Streptomyces sp. URMC 126]|uniref:winged helix-turn-helix transcriptional regulator n=1 Tax=Streptomyces sp. URMC 126 TaxID=3423401 RepID=UPI003F1B4CBE
MTADGPTAPTGKITCTEALAFNVYSRDCPSRETLFDITGRWGTLALTALLENTLRFNELRRRVEGVSEKMLSQTLQVLERDGLVHRTAQPTNPPRVDYALTPLGVEVAERLMDVIELVQDRQAVIEAARRKYDAERA